MGAATFSHGDGDYLSDAQLAQLLRAIRSERVSRDPKGMSYVEAYEIRAHLNRIFGFLRWDEVITEQRQVFEDCWDTGKVNDKGRPILQWTTCWYAHCTLTLRAPNGTLLATYGEGATGDATNQPSRADAADLACKTAASQALKRCAYNLGDQYGLGLFNKGSLRPLVRGVLWPVLETDAPPAAGGEVDAHITSPLAPESGEPNGGEPQREVTSPPASKAPPLADAGPVSIPAVGGGGRSGGSATTAETSAEGMVMHGSIDLGLSESDAAALEAEYEAMADAAGFPTAADADGGSPAGSGEPASESPVEEPAVETDPTVSGHVAETVASSVPLGARKVADEAATPESGDAVSSAEPGSSAETVDPTTPAGQGSADPTPGSGSGSTAEPSGIEDPIDAWEHITAALAVIRMSPPEEALGILNDAMEMAARFGLGTRRYLDTDKALSVVLTDTMRDARAAIERRRAAAAGAS